MNCKHCGKWVDGQPAFCYHCGEPTVKGKKAVMWAAILSALLLGASAVIAGVTDYTESMRTWHHVTAVAPMVEMLACAILLVGFIRTAFTREMSVITVLGFLFMISANGEKAWECLSTIGPEGCAQVLMNPGRTSSLAYFEPLIKTILSVMMTLWSFLGLRSMKPSTGSILRVLWLLPVLVSLYLGAKWSYIPEVKLYLSQMAQGGVTSHYYGLSAMAQLMMLMGICAAALCLFYACKEPAPRIEARPVMPAAPAKPVQPVQPAQPVRPVQPVQPVQPPKPAEPPKPAARPDPELDKKLAAYKDLLDCGILSREEYDRKVSQLTGGNGR